mmetsp:Transcript_1420/g.2868  ORF Transcript_1420/g.2868 Transcript_1420/m.2868 type:complete len:286 (-) Transcript_1420:1022-1879(-)
MDDFVGAFQFPTRNHGILDEEAMGGLQTRQEEYMSGSIDVIRLRGGFLKSLWRHFRNSVLDYRAALFVFFLHLVTLDFLIYITLAIITTSSFYYYKADQTDQPFSAQLDWNLFGFAVVFPITWNIGTAYRRRETALAAIASLKSLAFNIFVAHRDWNWKNAQGREKLNPSDEGHAAQVSEVLVGMLSHMERFLLLPCVNKSRHLYTAAGEKERLEIRPLWKHHLAEIQVGFNRLIVATERMKLGGMPANEAIRLNQYVMLLNESFGQLRFIKGYRTPEGIRSFAR